MGQEETRYDRTTLGPGAIAWVYEYRNRAHKTMSGLATGLELGLQLRGAWEQSGSRAGRRLYEPGSLHVISPAESYDLAFRAPDPQSGLQVGFIVYPDEVALVGEDEDVAFVRAPAPTPALVALCRAFAASEARPEEARAEVLRFVTANVTVSPVCPLVRAKRTIDKTFASALYVKHLAEVAGLSSGVSFSRKFAKRFGITPVAYRRALRLNEAARLTWARPDLSVAAIAELVGFDDEPHFHRAFRAFHGTTPAAYGRRAR